MPKSARDRIIAPTKVTKKGRTGKDQLFSHVQEALEKYNSVWLFKVDTMRNKYLKEIREEWSSSTIVLGKVSVMSKALGSDKESEQAQNIHKLVSRMHGQCGLLFTDEKPKIVKNFFKTFMRADFARAGAQSIMDFVLPAGVLYSTGGRVPLEEDTPMAHSMEPYLRELGLPTQLKRGSILLLRDYQVCKEGDTLTAQQAQQLKLFGLMLSQFKIDLLAYYDKSKEDIFSVAH